MNTAERIYAGVKRMPEGIARQVLDFVVFLEKRHLFQQEDKKSDGSQEISTNQLERLVQAARESFPATGKRVRDQEFAAMRNEWDRMP